jgi:hypothetical protein
LTWLPLRMKLSAKIKLKRLEIIQIVEKNHALFPRILLNDLQGYDLHETFLEIVVDRTYEFMPEDIGKIQHQLEQLLGVAIYAVTPNQLPDSHREKLLAIARVI